MFLHLGSDVCINSKNIIAVMDLETTSVSKITKEFLKITTNKGNVININSEELPKSYVITKENGKNLIYVSPISSKTLLKRSKSNKIIDI